MMRSSPSSPMTRRRARSSSSGERRHSTVDWTKSSSCVSGTLVWYRLLLDPGLRDRLEHVVHFVLDGARVDAVFPADRVDLHGDVDLLPVDHLRDVTLEVEVKVP